MNLLYVGALPPHRGGSSIVDAELLNGLVRRGHRCRALAPIMPEWGSDPSPLVEDAQLHVSRYIVPRYTPTTDAFFWSPDMQELHRVITVPRFLAALADDRPDAIILGNEPFGFHIAGLAAAHAIPTLLLAQNGNLPRAVLDGSLSAADARQTIEQLRPVDCIVAVARHLAAAWERLGFSNVRTIDNAVNGEVFAPRAKNPLLLRALTIDADAVIVAHVSNLNPVKRVGDLIRSAVRTLPGNPKLLYLIVGDGPNRDELAQQCRAHNVAGRFRFAGWVSYGSVADYLNLADMVVMPSASEGQSLAVLEAQACAKLVLASDIPGARELICHGETGLLFPVGAVADLADKTLHAAADPELRARIGGRARQAAQERSLHAMIAAYEEALRNLIDSSRGQKR